MIQEKHIHMARFFITASTAAAAPTNGPTNDEPTD